MKQYGGAVNYFIVLTTGSLGQLGGRPFRTPRIQILQGCAPDANNHDDDDNGDDAPFPSHFISIRTDRPQGAWQFGAWQFELL